MSSEVKNTHFVCYTDGSCRPTNPGTAGYGLFGYTYRYTEKPKNIKHPVHTNRFFTQSGIHPERDEQAIEVLNVLEVIRAINNPTSTNNEAELLAFICALEKASTLEDISTVTIYTDSNYIVTAFNENIPKWKANGWKRQDGKPIVHIDAWLKIYSYMQAYELSGIQLKAIWVKAHADNYCNNLADLYSIVGSNSARRQIHIDPTDTFTETVYESFIPYRDYKSSYPEKDFTMFFRDLYFTSMSSEDYNYCFLSTSEEPNMIGKRDTASIFALNIGYVPKFVNDLKAIYRSIPRDYVATCCIKLSKFENKDFFRLTEKVSIDDLISRNNSNGKTTYEIIGDSSPFMFESGMKYPFMVNATALFSRMAYISDDIAIEDQYKFVIDVTDRIVNQGKLLISNKEKVLDYTALVEPYVKMKQKLLITVGYDIPSYLALKNIERDIKKVFLVVKTNPDNNFCTVYVGIETDVRTLYTVNIENKFLRIR